MRRLLLLLVSLIVVACGGCRRDGVATTAPPVLRLADKDDVPTLDPALGYDTASWQFEDMLFDTLLDYDEAGRLTGELAQRWQVSEDGLVYTFELRRDARFHNGRPVTAGDARLAIERVLAPATRSPGAELYRGIAGVGECASWPCAVGGLHVPAAQTLQVTLAAPDPVFLHKMAMPFAAPVPAEVVRERGDDFGRNPVGSGPFQLDEWRPGERLLLARNPHYYRAGEPRVAAVSRLVGVDRDVGWLKYLAGELDITTIPPPEFLRVTRDPVLSPRIRKVTTLRTQYIGLNCELPPFTDGRVRRAFNHAVNKEKLLRLLNDRGVVAKGFVPPGMPAYRPAVPGYPFDPQRARQLLREAGFEQGLSSTLWLRNDETAIRLGQSIQQDLAAVGVQVRLRPLAWGSFLEAIKRPRHVPMFLLGWEADFPDASNFLEVLLHSKQIGANNNTGYRNPEVDRRLDQAAQMTDAAARQRLLEEVERLAFDDAPWVFLYHPVTYEIVSQRVRDYELHPLRPARFRRVWLEAE
jgi:ABC-type transport system substrate-binding protein